MKNKPVLVYGASGHGKVVIDIIEQQGRCRIAGLIDDNPNLQGQTFCGYRVIGGFDQLEKNAHKGYQFVIAIGDNRVRKRICNRLTSLGYYFAVGVHPSAQVARDVSIGSGAVIMANVAVNPGTRVGAHVILNTGATVDHDCVIGDFVHISPGAHLGGGVEVKEMSWIGIGALVREHRKVGKNSVVGMGTVVVEDIPDNVVAFGVPGKIVRDNLLAETL